MTRRIQLGDSLKEMLTNKKPSLRKPNLTELEELNGRTDLHE